jgi:hypothetical protein
VAESSAIDPVEIQFDQPRRLYFNLKALRALDRVMGEVGIQKSLELIQALNFTTLERALWAGLLHEEPHLTVANVSKRLERFIDAGGDAGDLFTATYRAINESRVFGKPGGNQGNEQPEPATA